LRDFDYAHEFRSISLRYFNAAGADVDGEIGESHEPETHLIPLVLDAAQGKHSFVTVFGDDYDTPDGTCIRDYIHVTDLAEAHVLALNALNQGMRTKAYNLGNGRGFSVLEIIEETERVISRKVPRVIGSRREGDPAILVGAADLAKSELGWSPKMGSLSEILRTAWNWYRK
jgi:UDP-glucose 4-epimerase